MSIDRASQVPYLTPTNVKVFIGDIWLDDVVSISYNVEATRTPYFGFKSTVFDGVGYGPSIVTGSLVCLFRYSGYLRRVLNFVSSVSQRSVNSNLRTQHLYNDVSALSGAAAFDYKDGLATLITDLARRNMSELRAALENIKSQFMKDEEVLAVGRNKNTTLTETQAIENKPIDLTVWYGRGDKKFVVSTQELIKDVYFNGESKTVSILDGQGDQLLYEVYPFIAKRVMPTSQK